MTYSIAIAEFKVTSSIDDTFLNWLPLAKNVEDYRKALKEALLELPADTLEIEYDTEDGYEIQYRAIIYADNLEEEFDQEDLADAVHWDGNNSLTPLMLCCDAELVYQDYDSPELKRIFKEEREKRINRILDDLLVLNTADDIKFF